MSKLEDATELLSTLSRGEKAQVLRWAADDIVDAYPGVETTPGVCGDEPTIVRTRIPVWLLEQARRLGMSESEILRSWPTLGAEELVNAWNYVRSHKGEIDEQIQANEAA